MNRSSTFLRLLTFASLGNLAFSVPAHALTNGTLLVGAQVPDWAVGNFACSGTLITPRVMVTAGHCINGDDRRGFFLRKTGTLYYGKTATYPEIYGPFGDIGLVMTDDPFGGSPDVQTAPVASYKDEKLALRSGNNAMTSGTPLVIYAKNSNGDRTFATEARTTDAYRDVQGGAYRPPVFDSYKMFYRSVQRYRELGGYDAAALNGAGMPIFNLALANLIYGPEPKGFDLSDKDIDDAIVLTASQRSQYGYVGSPIWGGDSGGGIFFRMPDGGLRLTATISGQLAHPRLSAYWPWVVETLIKRGLRDDAIVLSQKVLGTPTWGANDRQGEVGQIYVYDNPYSGKIEYFRLASLGNDGRYWYFPTNQQDNEYWEYLGTRLPDINQATTPLGVWGANDRQGVLGDIYIYNNPYTRQVEYFRLTNLGADGRYWYFPIDQKNNEYWEYLGTDLPTRPVKYAVRVK